MPSMRDTLLSQCCMLRTIFDLYKRPSRLLGIRIIITPNQTPRIQTILSQTPHQTMISSKHILILLAALLNGANAQIPVQPGEGPVIVPPPVQPNEGPVVLLPQVQPGEGPVIIDSRQELKGQEKRQVFGIHSPFYRSQL